MDNGERNQDVKLLEWVPVTGVALISNIQDQSLKMELSWLIKLTIIYSKVNSVSI